MLMVQDYFEWCAGTSVAVCDQIGWRKVFLEERVRLSFIQRQLATPLKMPNWLCQAFGTRVGRSFLDNSTTLYGSVRVTNKVNFLWHGLMAYAMQAGLSSVGTSSGVRVDSTPPQSLVLPSFAIDAIGPAVVRIPDQTDNYQVCKHTFIKKAFGYP
jgi:hypothetical protein